MVVVAVLGGTGSVGRTLVEAIQQDGKHEVFVLARKAPKDGSLVPTVAVDYADISSLVSALESREIHTVISAISMYDEDSASAELNAIAAAEISSCTKRFIASNWGGNMPEDESLRMPFNYLRERSLSALRKTSLEYTCIVNGFFLDYLGMPHIPTHLAPLGWVLDMGNRRAVIPGDSGEQVMSFTYTKDLGEFVVAVLGIREGSWKKEMWCFSETLSLRDVVGIAEEVTGEKFIVTCDSVDTLRRGEVTEFPLHVQSYQYMPKPMLTGLLAMFGLWYINGVMLCPKDGSLNEQFPEIQTTSARDVIGVWKGK